MAGWLDFFSLLFTTALFVGVVIGVIYAGRAISQAVESTKSSLKDKGINISDKGVSVKTKQYNRSDYLDSTQRGVIKALNASSFGTEQKQKQGANLGVRPAASRSRASVNSVGSK